LRLLDEVELEEWQVVHLRIFSEREHVDAALGDLLVEMPKPEIDGINVAALREKVAEAFRGSPPLSEDIIAERRSSP
jgi:hypothetical protein